eukprot:Rhum_TRINITY_DN13328_c0_g2::Rhum_TRINITY_DN13328_c0_g2_i1::g.59288::m.59288
MILLLLLLLGKHRRARHGHSPHHNRVVVLPRLLFRRHQPPAGGTHHIRRHLAPVACPRLLRRGDLGAAPVARRRLGTHQPPPPAEPQQHLPDAPATARRRQLVRGPPSLCLLHGFRAPHRQALLRLPLRKHVRPLHTPLVRRLHLVRRVGHRHLTRGGLRFRLRRCRPAVAAPPCGRLLRRRRRRAGAAASVAPAAPRGGGGAEAEAAAAEARRGCRRRRVRRRSACGRRRHRHRRSLRRRLLPRRQQLRLCHLLQVDDGQRSTLDVLVGRAGHAQHRVCGHQSLPLVRQLAEAAQLHTHRRAHPKQHQAVHHLLQRLLRHRHGRRRRERRRERDAAPVPTTPGLHRRRGRVRKRREALLLLLRTGAPPPLLRPALRERVEQARRVRPARVGQRNRSVARVLRRRCGGTRGRRRRPEGRVDLSAVHR